MDPRLVHYYNRELHHLREMGGEFARELPKIAGRLGLESFECADPYVERLIEAFAFLAARLQLKLDSSYEVLTHHLLEVIYPGYLQPTPSMLVAQLNPNLFEPGLATGFKVPRGTVLRGRLGPDQHTACQYRTGHECVLWPLEIESVEHGGYRGELGAASPPGLPMPKGVLRLRLRTTGGLNFCDTELDNLTLYLRGAGEIAMAIYEQLSSKSLGLVMRPLDVEQEPWTEVALDDTVRPVGFRDDESLLSRDHRAFSGYGLLQEYFAFPARYMFLELRGLGPAVKRCQGDALEVIVLLEERDEALDGSIDVGQFALHCTPAINVFPKLADPIHLSDSTHEHHVVADRSRPLDYEVLSIEEVQGLGRNVGDARRFLPLYGLTSGGMRSTDTGHYTVRRQPRQPSLRQRERGPRSSYLGSEVFLNLVDAEDGPFSGGLRQLAVKTLCTNRDLPLLMPVLPSAERGSDMSLESGAPVESVRVLAGPTSPKASFANGIAAWRLISHLSLNYLSFTGGPGGDGAKALRELLSLYGSLGNESVRAQIEGLVAVSSQPVTRRLPVPGPPVFGRGIEVAVNFDETAFEGSGTYLIGAVLERFFARYASINSFTETVLQTVQRGEVTRWPVRLGRRHTL